MAVGSFGNLFVKFSHGDKALKIRQTVNRFNPANRLQSGDGGGIDFFVAGFGVSWHNALRFQRVFEHCQGM